MILGLDFLALPKYADVAVREFPNGWALGAFSNLFGDALPTVKRIVDSGRCNTVRLHLAWDDNHNFAGKTDEIVAEAKRVKRFIRNYNKVSWYISPACEYGNSADGANLCKKVASIFGALAKIVSAPQMGKVQHVPNTIQELHGANVGAGSKGYIYSWDGDACVDGDVSTSKKTHATKAGIYFLWEPRFNGRWETNDTTPREKRKGWPDSRLIDSVIYLNNKRGRVALPQSWTYKSHSENKGTNDPRAEMPVLLSTLSTQTIELKTTNGQVVGTGRRFDPPFVDGRYRHYFDDWGYLIAEKAIRIHGSPIVQVWANGKLYGTVNPAFRQGDFR